MRLKYFGGPMDQKYCDVPNNFKPGDAWRVQEIPKLSVVDFTGDFDPHKELNKPITMIQHIYIVETLLKYKFLRYEKMTIEEVFDKIFNA